MPNAAMDVVPRPGFGERLRQAGVIEAAGWAVTGPFFVPPCLELRRSGMPSPPPARRGPRVPATALVPLSLW